VQSTLSGGAVTAIRGRRWRLMALLEHNGTLVMVLSAFALVLVLGLREAVAADGWMALLSGREIVQHGLPSHDALTVWAHGHRWVDQQWLAQLTLYGLARLGGIKLVLFAHVVLTAGGLIVAALVSRRFGGSSRSTTWVSLIAMFSYFPVAITMRPQSFAYILFAAVFWLLTADGRAPSLRVYAVLPLIALWANLHGSVVLGAALVSLYAAVAVWRRRVGRTQLLRARELPLAGAAWLCVLASPYALALPGYYRQVFTGSDFARYVTEWSATTLTLGTVPFFLLALGGIWLLGRAGGRVSAFEKLAFVGSVCLGIEALRNLGWFALVAVAVLPRALDGLRGAAAEPGRLNRLLATVMLAGLVVASIGVAAKPDSWLLRGYSPAAADAAAAAAGPHGDVFANEAYADWLIWRHPELRGRVAFDSRFELLAGAQLQSVSDFRKLAPSWRSTVRGYPVLVLDRQDDKRPEQALLGARGVRVIASTPEVLVQGAR
jgi:hypothetical protein